MCQGSHWADRSDMVMILTLASGSECQRDDQISLQTAAEPALWPNERRNGGDGR